MKPLASAKISKMLRFSQPIKSYAELGNVRSGGALSEEDAALALGAEIASYELACKVRRDEINARRLKDTGMDYGDWLLSLSDYD